MQLKQSEEKLYFCLSTNYRLTYQSHLLQEATLPLWATSKLYKVYISLYKVLHKRQLHSVILLLALIG